MDNYLSFRYPKKNLFQSTYSFLGGLEDITEEYFKKIVRACHQFTLKELKQLIDSESDCFPSTVKSAQVQKIIIAHRLEPNKHIYINVLEEVLRVSYKHIRL